MNGAVQRQQRAVMVATILGYRPADPLERAERLFYVACGFALGTIVGAMAVTWVVA